MCLHRTSNQAVGTVVSSRKNIVIEKEKRFHTLYTYLTNLIQSDLLCIGFFGYLLYIFPMATIVP